MVKSRSRVREKAGRARRHNRKPRKSQPGSRDAVSPLQAQLDQRTYELREVQEQQAASSKIVSAISRASSFRGYSRAEIRQTQQNHHA